jgi:predicted dehydrogenase
LTLKAIYSRSSKSAKALAEGVSQVDVYSEDSEDGKRYKDLLAREDVHAVVIALPILSQPEYIKQALSAGKHVLSEKPIAADLKTAQELIKWYRSNVDTSKVTWGIAENFRYFHSFEHAKTIVPKLGRILTFRARMQTLVTGGKYYETEWRKVPEYQGGFVLDGGIHFYAGIRFLLGSDYITRLSAQTAQLQKHLPPVDTVEMTGKTKGGAVGTISVSFGTTMGGSGYSVGGENGSVSVDLSKGVVTTNIDGKEESTTIEDERSGVPPEIRAWGEGLAAGKPDPKQSPEEGLADLELVEKTLRSGEQGGAPQDTELQTNGV